MESEKFVELFGRGGGVVEKRVAREDTERADTDKLMAEARVESEQRLIHLYVALVGLNWAEKLKRSLVT